MSCYGGIGRWAATFACEGQVEEGQVVKLSGSGTVSACAAGEKFGGTARPAPWPWGDWPPPVTPAPRHRLWAGPP